MQIWGLSAHATLTIAGAFMRFRDVEAKFFPIGILVGVPYPLEVA